LVQAACIRAIRFQIAAARERQLACDLKRYDTRVSYVRTFVTGPSVTSRGHAAWRD